MGYALDKIIFAWKEQKFVPTETPQTERLYQPSVPTEYKTYFHRYACPVTEQVSSHLLSRSFTTLLPLKL